MTTAILIIIALAIWAILLLAVVLFLKGAQLYDEEFYNTDEHGRIQDLDSD